MTEQQSSPFFPESVGPVRILTEPGTRLQQLHAAYDQAKADADAAAERLKGISDAIKLELSNNLQSSSPGSTKVLLTGTEGATPLQLTYVESWRVDAKKLKAENPLAYVTYAVKSGSWRLSAVKSTNASGGGEDE